jgi:hypothetical protein
MSAYLVDKATIDAIVSFAHTKGQSITVKKLVGPGWTSIHDLDPHTIGHALWTENAKSVAFRYDEPIDETDYAYRPVHARVDGSKGGVGVLVKISAADIVRIIDCLEYQSCEHPEWEESWACDTLRRIKECAVQKLIPESAPWGLRDGQVA